MKQAAERQGLSADARAVRLLEQHLPTAERRAELLALLSSWIDGDDVAEQQETGKYLIRVLDVDRLSSPKLLPLELRCASQSIPSTAKLTGFPDLGWIT